MSCTCKKDFLTEFWFGFLQKQQGLSPELVVEMVRDMQRLDGMEGDYDEGSARGPGRRKTIRNLEKSKNKAQAINTLDVAFKKRFFSLAAEQGTKIKCSLQKHRTIVALNV